MCSPDISYTRAPASIKLLPDYMHDSHSTFWAVARLAFPEERKRVLDKPEEHPTRPSERKKVMIPPDEQLVCYDFLYYLCSVEVSLPVFNNNKMCAHLTCLIALRLVRA